MPEARDQDQIDVSNVDFHEIARRGDTEVMDMFLDAGLDPDLQDAQNNSLLMIAAYNGQLEMTRLLLDAGADPDLPGARGNTPLMGVCFKGYLEVAEELLARGAQVNARGGGDLTPLMMAALFNKLEFAKLFLAHGADAALTNLQGQSAAAIASANGFSEMADLLENLPDDSSANLT